MTPSTPAAATRSRGTVPARLLAAAAAGLLAVTALALAPAAPAAAAPAPVSSLSSSSCPELIRQGQNDSGCVVRLQTLLNRAGAAVAVDGDFGPRTYSAVRSYQSGHSLGADGIVGPRTKASLEGGSGGGSGVSPSTRISQASAESQLRAAGISWSSSGGCTTRSNPSCTSLDQVRQLSITRIIDLDRASGCTFVITGGTEVGHAGGTYSHYNGYKIDIRPGSCIDGYITSTFTRIGTRGDGAPQWQSAAGNTYADEGNHWDITFVG